MEQGIRLTTGAEFAARDAPPTPVQFDRLLPAARELFPLGEQAEAQTWLGARPCFPDSRPVIARAPRHGGLWLACGHAHWGLTLGPATGRLIAEMMTGATPFCDPAPYGRIASRNDGAALLADRLDYTRLGAVLLLDEYLSCVRTMSSYFDSVVTGSSHHVHDLIAGGFELTQQFRQRFRGRVLEIMHQEHALPVFASLVIADLITSPACGF